MNQFKDRVGEFFKNDKGELFEMVAYCEEPTVTLQPVGVPAGGGSVGVNSLIANGLKPIGKDQSDAIRQYREQMRKR